MKFGVLKGMMAGKGKKSERREAQLDQLRQSMKTSMQRMDKL